MCGREFGKTKSQIQCDLLTLSIPEGNKLSQLNGINEICPLFLTSAALKAFHLFNLYAEFSLKILHWQTKEL